jgi:hypothetical protein
MTHRRRPKTPFFLAWTLATTAAVPLLGFAAAPAAWGRQDPTAPAAAAPASKPVHLKLRFKEGDVHRYRSVATISSPALGDGDARESSVSRETVTRVNPDGSAVIETVLETHQVLFNGSEIPSGDVAAFPKTVITMTPAAKLSEYKLVGTWPGGGDLQRALAAAGSMSFPDKPLRAGETWAVETDNPVVAGKKIKSAFTYVGGEVVAGNEADRIRQVFELDLPGAATPLKADLTLFLDKETGRRVKVTGKLDDVPIPTLGAAGIRLEQTLLAPADEKKRAPTSEEKQPAA